MNTAAKNKNEPSFADDFKSLSGRYIYLNSLEDKVVPRSDLCLVKVISIKESEDIAGYIVFYSLVAGKIPGNLTRIPHIEGLGRGVIVSYVQALRVLERTDDHILKEINNVG